VGGRMRMWDCLENLIVGRIDVYVTTSIRY